MQNRHYRWVRTQEDVQGGHFIKVVMSRSFRAVACYVAALVTILAVWRASILKKCSKRTLLSAAGSHTRIDHSAEKFAQDRRVLKVVKAF